MIEANLIFKPEIKEYDIERLDSLTTSPAGKQIKNKTTHKVNIAIYNKGKKVIRNTDEDSYTISTIHIYSESDILNTLDEILFDGMVHIVLEEKNKIDFSFYRAVANV